MGRFSNISVARYRRLLSAMGLKLNRTHGGHEMWIKEGMLRNAVFQTHEEPVPEDIVLNNLRTIGMSKKEFEALLNNIK